MRIMLQLMALIAGFAGMKVLAVVPGTLGPRKQSTGTAPVEGTNAVHNVEVGGTPTGGSFKLAWNGIVTAAIAWSATTNILLANARDALMGKVSVQTLTFAGMQATSKFRLSFRGQETAAITWSATNNTLRDNVDSALEALANIGTSGVTVAVGTMSSGIGTLTVTFAARGWQPLLRVVDVRLTAAVADVEPTIGVTMTTEGTDGPIKSGGVTVADVDLSSGIGNFSVTFAGEDYGKQVVDLIELVSNDLTGTSPTVEVTETTPGLTAFARGLLAGGTVADITDGTIYHNTGTPGAPDYVALVDTETDQVGGD